MKRKKEVTILYVMDALRPDHLGCYGYTKPTSTFIDTLASDALVFQNIYSQSTETKSSAATIFTSTYTTVHNTKHHSDHLPCNFKTLASCFKEAGFVTAGFNTNFRIGSEFNFATGFDHYSDLYKQKVYEGMEVLPPSEAITKEILEWLDSDSVQNANKIFIMVWAVDTHLPFTPSDECIASFFTDGETIPSGTIEDVLKANTHRKQEKLIALYDAEIAHNDEQLQCLVDGLIVRGLWDNANFLLTADHGETFMEHKHFFVHGSIPHKEITHVPFILKGPTIPSAIQRSYGGLIDIMPTLLKLNGIPNPEFTQGHDLLTNERNIVFMESILSYGYSAAVITPTWRLVRWASPVNYLGKHLKRKTQQPQLTLVDKAVSLTDQEKFQQLVSFKQARRRRYLVDLKGTPPAFSWNIFGWVISVFKYYCCKERFELYYRTDDADELRNVTVSNNSTIVYLAKLLDQHLERNDSLVERIDLQQEKTTISDDVTSRLRSLGYLD